MLMTHIPRTLLLYATVCAIAGMGLAGCSKNRDHHDHPSLTTGKELFDYHCAECHGEDGTGRLVDRTPANILTRKSAQEIVNYIVSDTGQGRKMPVFATMPREEAAKIAAYLIELKNKYDSQGENERKNRELLIDPEKPE